MYHIQP